MNPTQFSKVQSYLQQLQNTISAAFESEENGATFETDLWTSELGQGETRSLEDGLVWERATVSFSNVCGDKLPRAALEKSLFKDFQNADEVSFRVQGISLIVHPRNPYVPSVHANLRFFVTEDGRHAVWWFGGGYDLTPYYGFKEDCQHWHRVARSACEPFGKELYRECKQAADEYFYLKHRQEARGIGGLFFDGKNEGGFERTFSWVQSVGNSFLEAYLPIVQRRRHMVYGKRERDFQLYRRGRYVEFNLLQDRGTQFGLKLGGRVESILASLPPSVCWRYNWQPTPGTPEADLYDYFLVPRDWT